MDRTEQQLVTFYMPRSDARRVLDAANEIGLSRSALIRQLLEDFLDTTETEQQ